MTRRRVPALFTFIPEARHIIDTRKLLTHEYLKVSDRLAWGAIEFDLPVLTDHYLYWLQELNPA